MSGPRGTVVSSRDFSNSDATGLSGNLLMDLAAGDYTLIIDGVNDMTAPMASAAGSLAKRRQSDTGHAGVRDLVSGQRDGCISFRCDGRDRYYFDFLGQAGSGWVYWRLLDPFGNVIFDASAFSMDQGR